MRRFDVIISYDIADAKRLRKMAKLCEREGMRFQYSLYVFYEVTKKDVERFVQHILEIIDEQEDDVRIYRVADFGITWGRAVNLTEPFLLV